MAKSAPTADIDESKVRVSSPATEAVGVPAVMHALEMSIEQMGLVRSARTLHGAGTLGRVSRAKSRRRNESRIGRITVFLLSGPIKN